MKYSLLSVQANGLLAMEGRSIFAAAMKSVDKILAIIETELPKVGVECLLIGGFAVNYYGYTRNTLDVDFMIAANHLADVSAIMRDAGYINIDIRHNVAFFSTPEPGLRVDFLRVDDQTMEKLVANAIAVSIYGHTLKIPTLRDLIAMKIFSLRHDTERRMGKDLPDIAYLTVINQLGLESDIQPLCDRFGNDRVLELIRKQVNALRAS